MKCWPRDRKSTRLNSSHLGISYAVFCLKKKYKAIREAGYAVLLLTSNHPAILPYTTLFRSPSMTHPKTAHRTYIELITPFFFKKNGAPENHHFSPPRASPN